MKADGKIGKISPSENFRLYGNCWLMCWLMCRLRMWFWPTIPWARAALDMILKAKAPQCHIHADACRHYMGFLLSSGHFTHRWLYKTMYTVCIRFHCHIISELLCTQSTYGMFSALFGIIDLERLYSNCPIGLIGFIWVDFPCQASCMQVTSLLEFPLWLF